MTRVSTGWRCPVDGCGLPARARGLCRSHYERSPQRKAAHNARVLARRAGMSPAERFAQDSNIKMVVRYGRPSERITAGDLPPNDECAYCATTEGVTWDHFIPLARNGGNVSTNIVPACGPCNRSKNGRTPDEWLAAGLYATLIAAAA